MPYFQQGQQQALPRDSWSTLTVGSTAVGHSTLTEADLGENHS